MVIHESVIQCSKSRIAGRRKEEEEGGAGGEEEQEEEEEKERRKNCVPGNIGH